MLCAFPMLLAGAVLTAESEAPPSRWSLGPDGALTWRVDSDPRLPHRDHIEMSGRSVSPVSYTHLDVYKRQFLCGALHINRLLSQGRASFLG